MTQLVSITSLTIAKVANAACMQRLSRWTATPYTSEGWANKNYQFAIGYASAVFDGIRALQLGEEEDGAIHYPDSPRLVAVLAALSDLVRDHCSAPVDRSLPGTIGNAGISHFLTLARNSTSRRCRTQHSIVSGKLVPAQFSLIALP